MPAVPVGVIWPLCPLLPTVMWSTGGRGFTIIKSVFPYCWHHVGKGWRRLRHTILCPLVHTPPSHVGRGATHESSMACFFSGVTALINCPCCVFVRPTTAALCLSACTACSHPHTHNCSHQLMQTPFHLPSATLHTRGRGPSSGHLSRRTHKDNSGRPARRPCASAPRNPTRPPRPCQP